MSDEYAFASGSQFPSYSSQSVEESPSPTPPSGSAPSGSGKKLRGSSFTVPEDIELVKAWLDISVDSIHGNDQNRNSFWGRVHDTYHAYKTFASDRDLRSLKQRWSHIQASVNKFCGAIDQMHGTMSGSNEQDKIIAAKMAYEATNKKKFVLDHAWNLLKLHPKWISERAGKTHASSANISEPITLDNDDSGSGVPLPRPPGRNAEKRKAKEREEPKSSQHLQKLLETKQKTDSAYLEALAEKRETSRISLELRRQTLELAKEKAQRDQQMNDQTIMFMNTTGMSPDQIAFVELQRKLIMERLQGPL